MFTKRMTPVLLPHKRKVQTSQAVIDLAVYEVYKVSLMVSRDDEAWTEGTTACASHRSCMSRAKWHAHHG
jgi:hypothetical protein